MADKWLFILPYVTQNPSHEGQGHLFGMSQAHAHKWIQLLQAVLSQALAYPELLPARTAADLATLLAAKQTEAGPTPARFFMMGAHDPSTARQIPRTSKTMTVARRRVTRSNTSS
jgi:hypothetical protein